MVYIYADTNLTFYKKLMNKQNHNIYFNTRDELTKVCLDDVMYVTSEGNYLVLRFKSGRTQMLLASLSNFEQLTKSVPDVHFLRIGRSHVVNLAYISQVNSLRKTITLVDDSMREALELVVPKEAIRALKQTMEQSLNNPIPCFHTHNGNMEAYREEE